jgi:hypothetical protein
VLEQHLTRPEEEEKVSEHKAIFLDALKKLKVSRKYMGQFDSKNNIIVICNEVLIELYRLRAQETKKQKKYYQMK